MAEDVARLYDEVDRSAQRFATAGARIGSVCGSDTTGEVTATVDEHGVLQDVRVRSSWRVSLQPSMLNAAVQEAIGAAAAQRVDVWATKYVEQSADPEPANRPMATPAQSLAAQMTALAERPPASTATAPLEALLEMLESINAGIDELTADLSGRADTEYTGRSGAGHVRATVNGSGSVTALSYDQRWIGVAHHVNVGRETIEAIHAAYREMARRDVQASIRASSLGDVLALANDPRALIRRLRLDE